MSDLSHIYAKLHENRFEHVIRARRERELQAENYRLRHVLSDLISDHEYMTDTDPDEDNMARAAARAALNGQSDT